MNRAAAAASVIAIDVETSAGETFQYEFCADRVSIGRSALADVRLPELGISSLHAVIEHMDAALFVIDLGSTNGTRLNAARIAKDRRYAVRPNDEIGIGSFRLRVRALSHAREPTSRDATSLYARRMVRSALSRAKQDRDATLTVVNGPQAGRQFLLTAERSEWYVGRDEANPIPVIDELASRHHATVIARNGEHWVLDVGAKNGLTVNRARVAHEIRLRDRDEIEIGRTRLVFEDPSEGLLAALENARDEVAPAPAPQQVISPIVESAPAAALEPHAAEPDSTRAMKPAKPPRRVFSRTERVALTLVGAGFLLALAIVLLILSGGLRCVE